MSTAITRRDLRMPVCHFADAFPPSTGRFGLKSVSLERRFAKMKLSGTLTLRDSASQAFHDQRSQRRALPRSELTRLLQQRGGNLYGCLHIALCIMNDIGKSNASHR